jgi:hypothetical protein
LRGNVAPSRPRPAEITAYRAVRNRKSPTLPWIGKEKRGTMMPNRLTDTLTSVTRAIVMVFGCMI